MELLLIANPSSGTRQVRRFLPDLIALYNRSGYDCRVFLPGPGLDATDYVAARCEGADLVVCAGGDGTLNRTASGILRSGARVPLGYIPSGSSNVFGECLGISSSIPQAARDILTGQPQAVDMGLFNDHPFICVASFGAFCRTSYATPQNAKNVLGRFAYFLEGAKDALSIRALPMELRANGQTYSGEYLFGAITNVASVGGVFRLDPREVNTGDGLFEVVLVKAPKTPLELQLTLAALTGQDFNSERLVFLRTDKLSIDCPADMEWTLDGEYEPSCAHAEVANLPQALQFIVPDPSRQPERAEKKRLDKWSAPR